MSKRSREEEAAAEARVEKKKEKKTKRRKTEDAVAQSETTTPGTATPDLTNGETDEDARKAAKAARKAARKAEKAEKKAKKQKKEEEAATDDDETAVVNGNGTSKQVEVAPAQPAASESEVAEFLKKSQITFIDETNTGSHLRPVMSFDQLQVANDALKPHFTAFKAPTPIQAAAWPYLLSGRDAIGVAETGSGKTLAFGLPCVNHVYSRQSGKKSNSIGACIVSPTRELALQIHEQLEKLASRLGLKVVCVYGGVNKDQQRATLDGASIVVATPGRLNDFIDEGSISLKRVSFLVLDEADRMLDKGFEPEIRKIVGATAGNARQTLMFTATWPQVIRDLAATFMNNPIRIMIGDNATGELRANTRIDQKVEVLDPRGKNDRLLELLRKYNSSRAEADRTLIFCLYKKEAVRVEDFVRSRGFKVAGIHGDLSQQKRMESLEAFKQGKVRLLIATDVAARGLDIPAVKLVINYTFPLTADDYVHRIGRTGRAGQTGESITFFTEHDKGLAGALVNVLKAANQPVPDELLKFGTTVKKKAHDVYGAFYKDPGEMKKATKITFD
ncbi:DEAD-domain-containing protein [Myriangium duriaei CBS 260.36]|uniref:RNA helicase n=1 Tax=Myriangium duriaei CBS 260.36 TaxID=1168546 RepID=A0A9P4J7V5_9PEZI|nr:DEAD-domain-containing protein [Myriangium duriaei CBS 260.36]